MAAIGVFHARSGPAPESAVRAMARSVPHRGTETLVAVAGSTAVSVTTRVGRNDGSIASNDGSTAVFAGRLDNRVEIDRALEREPADGPAAATIAAAFRRWGDDAPARLRGSFTAAVTDGRRVRVFRDHFGTKPLFYRYDARGFYAATEIKQIAVASGIGRVADPEGLEDVLFGTVGSRTAVAGIRRVDRGSLMSAEPGAPPRVKSYWDPRAWLETDRAGVAEAVEGVLAHLRRAVERAATSDAVVLLSGGLDSPAIAALEADRHVAVYGHPLAALTAVYPDHPSVDEHELVDLIAARLGLALSTYAPEAGVLDDVEHWVDLADGPTDTLSLPQAAEAYRAARAVGASTVLTGEMAEYVFELRHYLIDHLVSHRRFTAATRVVRTQRARGRRVTPIAKELARAVLPPSMTAALVRARNRDPRRLPPWVDPRRVGGGTSRPDLERSASDRWKAMQIAPFAGAAYTFEADEICAASCGVDVRWPFADIDLWQYVLGLRAEVKFPDPDRKPLLRRAVRPLLPPEIVERRTKTTFDEYSLAKAEYDEIKRVLKDDGYRASGIDYRLLGERLEQGSMTLVELTWARDLARVHAFAQVCA